MDSSSFEWQAIDGSGYDFLKLYLSIEKVSSNLSRRCDPGVSVILDQFNQQQSARSCRMLTEWKIEHWRSPVQTLLKSQLARLSNEMSVSADEKSYAYQTILEAERAAARQGRCAEVERARTKLSGGWEELTVVVDLCDYLTDLPADLPYQGIQLLLLLSLSAYSQQINDYFCKVNYLAELPLNLSQQEMPVELGRVVQQMAADGCSSMRFHDRAHLPLSTSLNSHVDDLFRAIAQNTNLIVDQMDNCIELWPTASFVDKLEKVVFSEPLLESGQKLYNQLMACRQSQESLPSVVYEYIDLNDYLKRLHRSLSTSGSDPIELQINHYLVEGMFCYWIALTHLKLDVDALLRILPLRGLMEELSQTIGQFTDQERLEGVKAAYDQLCRLSRP